MDESAGMLTFPNQGEEEWSLLLKRFKVGDTNIFSNTWWFKKAHIDTANLWIQMPMSEFLKLKQEFLEVDPTIEQGQSQYEECPSLFSQNSCEVL